MIYFITGAPGTGKSTVSVQHAIFRYAMKGRRVVANFPIDYAPVCVTPGTVLSRASVHVIPDRPSRAALDSIGEGSDCDPYDEERAGLLIIDEAGVWLSARSWAGQEREKIIDWLSQSRKRRWDVILIAQGTDMIDKQVRNGIVEGVVRIRRTDRLHIAGIRMPRAHFATVRYGIEANAPVIERWLYRGTDAHRCFGSYRLFGIDNANYSVLPAMITKFARLPVKLGLRGVWRLVCAALGVGRDGGRLVQVVELMHRAGLAGKRTLRAYPRMVGRLV